MQKNIGFILIICLTISCKQHANRKLILGTWVQSDTAKNSKMRITFFPNNLATFGIPDDPTSRRDTIIYKFSDDENSIITTEKNGRNEKLTIYQLTKNELVFIRKKDTGRLVRK